MKEDRDLLLFIFYQTAFIESPCKNVHLTLESKLKTFFGKYKIVILMNNNS